MGQAELLQETCRGKAGRGFRAALRQRRRRADLAAGDQARVPLRIRRSGRRHPVRAAGRRRARRSALLGDSGRPDVERVRTLDLISDHGRGRDSPVYLRFGQHSGRCRPGRQGSQPGRGPDLPDDRPGHEFRHDRHHCQPVRRTLRNDLRRRRDRRDDRPRDPDRLDRDRRRTDDASQSVRLAGTGHPTDAVGGGLGSDRADRLALPRGCAQKRLGRTALQHPAGRSAPFARPGRASYRHPRSSAGFPTAPW